MEQQLKLQIIDFITGNFLFGDTEREVNEKDSLLENGIIDSTGVLELVAFIEEAYGIKVEDEEIIPENLDSIVNVVNFLQKKLNREGASASA